MRTKSEDLLIEGLLRLLDATQPPLSMEEHDQIELALAATEDVALTEEELRLIYRRCRELAEP